MNGTVKFIKKGPSGGIALVTVGKQALRVKVQLKSGASRKLTPFTIEGKQYEVAVNGRHITIKGNGSNDTYDCGADVNALAPAAAVVAVVAIGAFTYLADKLIDKMSNVDDFSVSVSVGDMALSVEASGDGGNNPEDGNTSNGDDDSSSGNDDGGDDDGGDDEE